MNTAVQVGLLGKFQSCQHIRTFSNTKVTTPSSAKKILFGAPEPGEIDREYDIFNEDNRKYLKDRYVFTTSKDEKSTSTSSICHHPNLIELERKEYESKMKNSKLTSKSY